MDGELVQFVQESATGRAGGVAWPVSSGALRFILGVPWASYF